MIIKHKRGTGTPTSLGFGEIAINSTADSIWVGNQESIPVLFSTQSPPHLETGFELIEIPVIDTNLTEYSFKSVLDSEIEKSYILDMFFLNNSGLSTTYYVILNDTTMAGTRQFFTANGATGSANRTTSNPEYIVSASSSGSCFARTYLNLPVYSGADLPRNIYNTCTEDSGSTLVYRESSIAITTPANTIPITSIKVVSTQTDGIGSGSVLRLFRSKL